jgi:gas vesicle protein
LIDTIQQDRGENQMDKNSNQDKTNVNHPGSFLAGALFGGLAGATAMLLLAPQSGKRTRAQLQLKGMELRDQTAETVDDAMLQTRLKVRQIKTDVREKAEELQQRGQTMLDEQVERVSAVVETGKQAVRHASV